MCVGIAIVGIVPESGPIQFFGKEGNSSHDTLLSECVPVELHNRSFKLEYIFPNTIRLDAPDAESRKQAVEFGIADIQYGIAILRPETALAVALWLKEHPLHHGRSTMQQAYLSRADLSRADLSRADLSGADLFGADLFGADLSGANLFGADLSGAILFGADLSGAILSDEQKEIAKKKGAVGVV